MPRLREVVVSEEPEEHVSMMMREALGSELASREIALALAEMILKDVYGDAHLKTQLPLHITDGGDRWIVEGSRQGEDYPAGPDELHWDKIVVEIRKMNCQVLKFLQMAW